MTLVVAHTADLDAETLAVARTLLYDAFPHDFEEADWEHALGGVHAIVWDGSDLVGHASVVQRQLMHGGQAFRTGYVEGVAVRADHRRRGHGAAMMDALERVIRGAYELGALGATDDGVRLYRRRGWQQWQGPLSTLTATGVERTREEEGHVYVLPVTAPLDLAGELTCDWRKGDVW